VWGIFHQFKTTRKLVGDGRYCIKILSVYEKLESKVPTGAFPQDFTVNSPDVPIPNDRNLGSTPALVGKAVGGLIDNSSLLFIQASATKGIKPLTCVKRYSI